jgi:hypothetical protein
MTAREAAKILREFNKWRRGEKPYADAVVTDYFKFTPTEIGQAIDRAVLSLERKTSRKIPKAKL